MTAAPKTWQEVQAAKPVPIEEALAAWYDTIRVGNEAPTDFDRMVNAVDAYEAALEVYRRCDDPGCTIEASCGWPVSTGGYRRTCYAHWAERPGVSK